MLKEKKRKNSPHNCPAIIYSAAACCGQGLRCSKQKEDFLCLIHCCEQIKYFNSRYAFQNCFPHSSFLIFLMYNAQMWGILSNNFDYLQK